MVARNFFQFTCVRRQEGIFSVLLKKISHHCEVKNILVEMKKVYAVHEYGTAVIEAS
jgi:hypothetical protein